MYWLNASASWTCRVNGEGEFQPTLDLSSVLFLQENFFLHVVDIILSSQQETRDQIQLRHPMLTARTKPCWSSYFAGASFTACHPAFALMCSPFFPHHVLILYTSLKPISVWWGLSIARWSPASPPLPHAAISPTLRLLPQCCLEKEYVHCTKVSFRLNLSW